MNEVATATWTNYLDLLGSGLDEPCPYHVVVLESSDPVWLTVDLECETIGTGTTEINRSDFVPELVKKLHETLKVSRNRLRPSLWRKRLVDYFARRFFGVPAVRSSKNSRQWELLSRTVAGIDALGIMPTGSGKSLSFQLPSILLPGAVLVICPLRSLMRDQVHNLRDFGINAADFISSDVAAPQRARIMDDFFSGRLQLLYISPERIQIKSFLQELRNESSRLNISCVAIDEAHCVSEWGHDFRPSYLQIPRFVTETLRTNNECPPILAVTATASPPVEADVRTIHHFENNDNVIKASSLDRRGISLSIHPSSPKSSKLETLGATLSNVIPSVLNTTFQKMVGHAESYDAGGIIFSVYANPHSTSTYRDGVGAIYDYLTSTEKLVDPELCRLHSSTVPQKCPRCGHYSYYNQKGARQQGIPEHYCSMCNEEFGDPATTDQKEWDSRLRESQDRFKRNEFPLMVATKGYGMGIDKRNIRYILHHGFSSSLEAYYQEAGRAGRDDQHSHCAIVTLPLHPDCERDYFDSHNPEKADYPGCLKGQDFTNWTCPHGLSELCDFGKQARFLKRNYPEVTTVLDRIMELWDELVAGETSPVKLRHGNTDNEKNANERAVYRLMTLGLVHDYLIDYSGGVNRSHILATPERTPDLDVLAANLLREAKKANKIGILEDKKTAEMRAAKLRQKVEDRLIQAYQQPLRATIQEMIEFLLEEVHREVQKMRLETLRSLRNYTVEAGCKRQLLLGRLGYPSSVECGFCDSCCPDLKFNRERAKASPEDEDRADVIHSFESATRTFDLDDIDKLLDVARKMSLQTSLIGMAEVKLESMPDNLGSRLIAGKLCAQRKDSRDQNRAFRHFRDGLVAADENYGDVNFARKFHEEAKQIDKATSADLLDRADGVFDTPQEHTYVYHELKEARPEDPRTNLLGTLLCAEKQASLTESICSEDNLNRLASLLSA